ncbi:MAG: ribosome maturation factor RimM [Aphanocapsa feldmannii 277cV]|uniref:Ribosome maturation factor RimM n=1 Tax=Aphanocapsa feldmannii 277cV TaxID=2507553 RepID=A0A524RQJ6_9CHRO|nr:MAG: ribosome maturation factor RimM [Aphanocapsa feldmannii 277cV]
MPAPRDGDRPHQANQLRRNTDAADAERQWLEVGCVVGAQGLRGEIRVLPLSEFPERFLEPGRRWLRDRQGRIRAVVLEHGRRLPGRNLYALRLRGILDRTAAQGLVRQMLLVSAEDRPALAEGEFHLCDLLGLEARLAAEGTAIGVVRDLHHAGNDLLELELHDGRRRLIPFVDSIVPELRLSEGWLLITPPPGLLEL